MQQSNDILVLDLLAELSVLNAIAVNLPEIVGILVRVSGHLLSSTANASIIVSQGVVVVVRVKVN